MSVIQLQNKTRKYCEAKGEEMNVTISQTQAVELQQHTK